MKPTTVGVIGAGRIGRMHLQNLVHSVPDAFVKTVASRSIDTSLADELGVPLALRDYEALLGDPEIEAVVVALSSDLHVEAICRAARAGKHIFCEKPIDLEIQRVKDCLRVVEDNEGTLMVGFNRRFDPDFIALKAAIDSGRIGKVEMVSITSRDPGAPPYEYVERSGGIFRDMTIHDFDVARWLLDEEIEERVDDGMHRTEQARGGSTRMLSNLQESGHLAVSLHPDPLEASAGTTAPPTNGNSALAQPPARLPTVKKKQEAPTILDKRGSTTVQVKKSIQIKPRLEGNRPLTE